MRAINQVRGFKTKKWQIEVKIYMPLFWRENHIGLIHKKRAKEESS
jgi:hypothetical protein